jgi:hypothetical protein
MVEVVAALSAVPAVLKSSFDLVARARALWLPFRTAASPTGLVEPSVEMSGRYIPSWCEESSRVHELLVLAFSRTD